jgi:hypothetical protein
MSGKLSENINNFICTSKCFLEKTVLSVDETYELLVSNVDKDV